MIATVVTEKNQSVINASFVQQVSRDQSIGAQYKYDITGKTARSLLVGTEYVADKDTLFKAKIELPSGIVQGVVEHRVRNPNVLLGIAASFRTGNNGLTKEKVGVTATLGDI